MATSIVLPKLGMTMLEGTITEWYVQPGDAVTPGDLLFAFETEKVNYDVAAEAAGTLHVLVQVDATVDAGSLVAYLLAPGEAPPTDEAPPPNSEASPAGPSAPTPSIAPVTQPAQEPAGEPGRASPAVRRLAAEHHIDLTGVRGSGVGGRILREDVVRLAQPASSDSAPVPPTAEAPAPEIHAPSGPVMASPAAKRLARDNGIDLATLTGTGPNGRIVAEDIEAALAAPPLPAPTPSNSTPNASSSSSPTSPAETIPFRGMRRTIGARMHESLQSMAQLTMAMDVDMTRAVALRQELIELWQDRDLRPTYTDFVIKAAALALRDHPRVNAELRDDAILLHPDIHVGFAVALDEGLIVPVTRHTDTLSLDQLAPLTADLAARARSGQLTPDDLTGGTFTVTSLGMYGVDVFTPIINPPQAAILGVGRIADRPVFIDDTGANIERRAFMTISGTIDHRILDGAPGADFMRTVKHILEHPSRMLLP